MQLLTFRIRRPSAMASITSNRPGLTLQTWCNLETDFVQVLAASAAEASRGMEDLLRVFGPDVAYAGRTPELRRSALVKCPANRKASVSVTVERHGGIVQPPIVSADGWDTFRVLLFHAEQAGPCISALRRLGEFELLSKRPLQHLGTTKFFVSSTELMHGLTRRQADAILAAVDHGYYEEPRATTLARLAESMGVGRASLEEHLRRAENKMMKVLAPFIAVKAGALEAPRPRGVPFAGKRRGAYPGEAAARTGKARP